MAEGQSQVAPAEELDAWLRDARHRTLTLAQDLSPEQLIGPYRTTVNPILWALGHVAWFQERWVWRQLHGQPPLHANGDGLFDSFEVEHPVRWELPLPSGPETLGYLAQVQEHVLEHLRAAPATRTGTYFHRLAILHEDMHAEAITYDRATLGYPAPPVHRNGAGPAKDLPASGAGGVLSGDVEVPGARGFALGSTPDMPYVWDNEKWAHPVDVALFRIARAPVTNAEYAAFVEAGGYSVERFWLPAAWRWLKKTQQELPARWRRAAGNGWEVRSFDQWRPLPERHPVIHVGWYEAQAFCAWAGRRLPTEAEWELAASLGPRGGKRRYPWGDAPPTPERANLDAHVGGTVEVGALPAGDSAWGCRQMLGNVWEWVQDPFYPYPGFVPDPYREYSAPWFGYHKVLRGGCWATRSRLVHNTWRNFFMPTRNDVLAGFRTCAL